VATRQEVGTTYREALSQGDVRVDGNEPAYDSIEWIAADAVGGSNGDWQDAVERLRYRATPESPTLEYRRADMAAAADWLEANHERVAVNRGNLYHVELDFDPWQVLDWDAAPQDQPAVVQQAMRDPYIQAVIEAYKADGSAVEQGADIYYAVARAKEIERGGSGRGSVSHEADKEASDYLASLGMRGIKYADALSRGNAPKKTHNYVVFSESDIRVVGRNGETITPSDAMEGDARAAQTSRAGAVTPEMDREYMDAVERGDTAEAQRMVDEAARGAGYNVGKVYNGMSYDPGNVYKKGLANSVIRIEGLDENNFGFFFTESEAQARHYAGDSGKVKTSFLKSNKELDLSKLESVSPVEDVEATLGFAGVKYAIEGVEETEVWRHFLDGDKAFAAAIKKAVYDSVRFYET
jgi:hypothetical protein